MTSNIYEEFPYSAWLYGLKTQPFADSQLFRSSKHRLSRKSQLAIVQFPIAGGVWLKDLYSLLSPLSFPTFWNVVVSFVYYFISFLAGSLASFPLGASCFQLGLIQLVVEQIYSTPFQLRFKEIALKSLLSISLYTSPESQSWFQNWAVSRTCIYDTITNSALTNANFSFSGSFYFLKLYTQHKENQSMKNHISKLIYENVIRTSRGNMTNLEPRNPVILNSINFAVK